MKGEIFFGVINLSVRTKSSDLHNSKQVNVEIYFTFVLLAFLLTNFFTGKYWIKAKCCLIPAIIPEIPVCVALAVFKVLGWLP